MLQHNEVKANVIAYIEDNGRAGLSELLADVLPTTGLTRNEFIEVLEQLDKEEHKIMAACIDGGGPRYQMFTFAFRPATVNYEQYKGV